LFKNGINNYINYINLKNNIKIINMMKTLFVLKRREDFDPKIHIELSQQCGLYNSILYVNNMLINQGYESQVSICIDNNCINGFIYKFKPTHVIVEAWWVVPSKIKLLQSMYPRIKWIIRLHSAIPFLSVESSQSMKWIADYCRIDNTFIGVNDPRLLNELSIYIRNMLEDKDSDVSVVKDMSSRMVYLPNYYPITNMQKYKGMISDDTIHIACFGAIRPFKNTMTQALASIEFCKRKNKKLCFHINSGRNELQGANVYENLIQLFSNLDKNQYSLICHPWASCDEFLNICSRIDIGLQVSFTETFNIVSADVLCNGIAIIGSSEIPWINKRYTASPQDAEEIIDKLLLAYDDLERNVIENQKSLEDYVNNTIIIWKENLIM
jgi:hypothetical protein